MPKTIDAIYENGVFKPLDKIDIKEHEKVRIKILSRDEWEKQFTNLIQRIQKKSGQYPAEEIESDIKEAVRESRDQKYAR